MIRATTTKPMALLGLFLVLVPQLIYPIDGKKILFISPSLSNSLLIQAGRLADLLVSDGHDVTYFIPEMNPVSRHNGSNLAKIVRMTNVSEDFAEEYANNDIMQENFYNFWRRINFADAFVTFCERVLSKRDELDALKAQKFDLVFTNGLDFCDAGLVHYLEIPLHIWIVTGPLHEINTYTLGIPSPPSYLPTLESDYLGTDLNFVQRIANLADHLKSIFIHRYCLWRMNALYRKTISPDFPSLEEIMQQTSLLFVNDDEFIEYARPILHKVIYIAGAGIAPVQPLSPEMEAILAKGKAGVFLVSFGTVIPSTQISAQAKQAIIRMTNHFPDYQFIIRADAHDKALYGAEKNSSNVDILSWMPQPDLLAHPKVLGCISHAGINTLIEMTRNGIPGIMIPLQFDQLRNAKLIEHRGAGITVLKTNITESSLVYAVSELIGNPSYRQAARRLSALVNNKPNQPDETFLRWTNFVLNYGPLKELNPAGARLDFFVYHCIDLLAAIIVILIAGVWVVSKIVRGIGKVFPRQVKSKCE